MSAGRRIAYLSSVYPRATDTFVRGEVEALRERGFEVHTFSVRRPPEAQLCGEGVRAEQARTVYLLAGGVAALLGPALRWLLRDPARTLATGRLAWRTAPRGETAGLRQLAYLFEALRLAETLRRRGVAHLHNHITANSARVAMLASFQSGIPWSTTVHGMELLDARSLALGASLERAAFTACISHYTRSQCMLHVAHEVWERLHVIRCGLPPELLEAKREQLPGEMRFVCVGRLGAEKGQLLLVDAAAELLAEGIDLELVLVGDGEQRPAIERRIRTLGLVDRVRITGWADRETVSREIRAARALVIPSLSEGLPVVAMEALALGRPVIATRVGGVPELVETGTTGWLVDPGSVEALVGAMREVADTDDAELLQRAARGAARVRERHDSRREAARLAALFGEGPA